MGRAFLSGGQLVSTKTPFPVIPAYSSSWFPWMPPMSTASWSAAYLGIYKAHLWVYVLVNKLAGAEARLPLPVYRRAADGRERVPDHPMARLLENPNPGMSGYVLREWTSATESIFGQAFWWKKRANREVVGLFPLHPCHMQVQPDGRWTFDNGTRVMRDIPAGDLVHFRRYEAVSPLEPLRATLENEWFARNATSSFWQRGARPGMAISHPQTISQPAQDRLRAQMDDLYAGSGNTGRTMLLEEGMKPEKLTLTAEEAQYIETRKLNREEVCAAYDVPPPVVHILDRATFSNITEQMRSMYRDTMGPPLARREAVIEIDLRRAEWPDDDVYAEHLMDEVLRGDFEARQEALNKADHMTIAEKRRIENLPFIDGTDRIFLNSATLPLDAIDAQFGPEAQPADDEPSEQPPRSLVRTALGRLNWQKTLDQVDPDAVCAGLYILRPHFGAMLAEEKRTGGTVASLRARLQGKQAELNDDQQKVAAVLRGFFERQGGLDPDSWDATLTRDLHRVALTVAERVGKATTASLGFDPDSFSVAAAAAFLLAVAERYAISINDTTRRDLAGGERAEVFAKAAESRAPGIAVGVTATLVGFAAIEAGQQAARVHGIKPTKTWVTGANPRPEHAAMNGETVGIDEDFSIGFGWPGEGDENDVGCNCTIEVSA